MSNLEEIKNQINDFIQHPPSSIILWGTGECGIACFKWLSSFGLESLVKGFVDSNSGKWGTTIFNLPVHSPGLLEQESTVSVIICTMFHFEIYDNIPNKQNRPIFVFENRQTYYQGEIPNIPESELYRLYSDDELTRTHLDLTLMMRKMFNFGGVIPYSLMKYVPFYCDYWNSEELSLSQYERITLVDGGAFTGDSIEHFNKVLGKRLAVIYAIEPDFGNFCRLQSTIEALSLSNISHAIRCGLSDVNTQAYFSGGMGMSSKFMEQYTDSSADKMLSLYVLDDIVQQVEGKLCIKMDIEGFELNALRGTAKLIRQYKPELSICVYHKYGDIFDIPKFIKMLVPEYNCILRGGPHLECYASVDRF